MNALLIFPQYPDSFWSFKHALRFVSKKAAVPPLGLMTISAMLPAGWKKKLVDLNVSPLRTSDLEWADYVLISAMYIQQDSVNRVLDECAKHNVKTIAGGPLFTQEFKNYPQVDHMILNEAEITLPPFLKDLESGRVPKNIYSTTEYADLALSPVPDYHLLSASAYASMNIQVSRGCPFACDFCEITTLLGHKVRMKAPSQVISELDLLYRLNWRGPVSIVDDNFIGNKNEVKYNLLPLMKAWMQQHNYPFTFNIQSTINLADDPELMKLMRESGFNSAFIGIETPAMESLQECNKTQNVNRNLLQSIKKMHTAGLQVSGGFIVGFDSDSPGIFQQQIDFIQQSGIVSAMVGLLNAPKNTTLYKRMESEDRLTIDPTGNNTDYTMNFVPRMNSQDLIAGYKKIIHDIYTTKPYYKRTRRFLLNYKPGFHKKAQFNVVALKGFIRSVFILGLVKKGRSDYWKFMLWTLFRRPTLVVDAITFSIYGYHYRKVFGLTR